MEKRGWKGSSDGGEMQRGIIDEEKKLCRTRTYLSKEKKKKDFEKINDNLCASRGVRATLDVNFTT